MMWTNLLSEKENVELLKKAEIKNFKQFQQILDMNNIGSQEELLEYIKKCNK